MYKTPGFLIMLSINICLVYLFYTYMYTEGNFLVNFTLCTNSTARQGNKLILVQPPHQQNIKIKLPGKLPGSDLNQEIHFWLEMLRSIHTP